MVPPSTPTTYLVETYIPNLDEATAAALSARLQAAIRELQREGRALRWLRSVALLDEETYSWMLTAADRDDVARVHRGAGVPFDHGAEVLTGAGAAPEST